MRQRSIPFAALQHVRATAADLVDLSNVLIPVDLIDQEVSRGALASQLFSGSLGLVNVLDYEADPTGTTDSTTVIQSAINDANGSVCYFPPGIFGVTSALTVPASTTLVFSEGASIKKLSGSGNIFTITSANARIVNPTIDLNGIGSRGIVFGAGSIGSRIDGTATILNSGIGGAATDGAVLIGSTSRINVQDIVVEDCSGTVGTYRGLDITSSTDVRVSSVSVRTGDIGVNVFASTNVSIGQVIAKNLTANCLYVKDATSHVVVSSIEADSVANGITLDSSIANAQVVIGNALISSATYGVDYRQSGGYLISNLHLVEAPLATTTSGTRSGLTIGSLRSSYLGSGFRPISVGTADYVTLQSVDVSSDQPLSGIACLFTDCNYLVIGSITVNGVGGSVTPEGVRFSASALTAPVITVGLLVGNRVTAAYTINSTITNPASVRIRGSSSGFGNWTMTRESSVVLTLKSLKTAVLSGDDLGEIAIYGSDTTLPGTKFRLLCEATDNSGASRTFLYNDTGLLVGVIPANITNPGMSITLPTSTAGLSSGMIWNNAGSVAIVP